MIRRAVTAKSFDFIGFPFDRYALELERRFHCSAILQRIVDKSGAIILFLKFEFCLNPTPPFLTIYRKQLMVVRYSCLSCHRFRNHCLSASPLPRCLPAKIYSGHLDFHRDALTPGHVPVVRGQQLLCFEKKTFGVTEPSAKDPCIC